jgi:hypothetical protein
MQISPITPEDRSAWDILARGYREFYNTPTSDTEFDTAWNRLMMQDGVFGLGAKVAKNNGFIRYDFPLVLPNA